MNNEIVEADCVVENNSQEKDSSEDDKLLLTSYINDIIARTQAKDKLRTSNQNAINERLTDARLSQMDSNLKRNTAFVKKIKNFSASHMDVYMKEVKELNLSKYISEIAAALVEAKLKMNDIEAAVNLCSVLHQMYSDFSQHFFENWQKALQVKIGDKIGNPSKLRVDLRFYAELLQVNLFNNKGAFSLLGNLLTTLINMDKEDHFNSSIILTFCKYCGDDYAGLIPRKLEKLSKQFNLRIPRSTFLPQEKQQNVKGLLKEYFISLCKHLLKVHEAINHFEQQNMKILDTKGELSQERKEKLDALQSSYHKLLATTQQFSDLLDLDMPVMRTVIRSKTDESMIVTGSGQELDENYSQQIENLWCDAETLRFYSELPELEAILPQLFTKKHVDVPAVGATEEVVDTTNIAEEMDDLAVDQSAESMIPLEGEDETMPVNSSNKLLLEAFINNLPNCVNRELIDNAAIDFLVTLNNKHNRKKIIRALFGVNRTRLDLLPFYARFVAILTTAISEMATELCSMLKQDFRYHIYKKDQINFESKIKVVRFIGELVKFNLYAKNEALGCVKVLLNDFSHHNIEMACNLLEVCGRFLYCHPESHQRMRVYLEQMMRKKAVMALDSRYVSQIESAYYHVIPPEMNIVVKERPIIHQFIRKLLYQDLHKNNTDKIIKLIRKLDWNDPEISAYAIKCLSRAYNIKYLNIRYLANLLAGLVAYQEELGAKVVDSVLEDVRLGMEVNLPKYNQKRVAQIKYLGELYNYRMVESADIFKMLYTIISFGVSSPNLPSALDPPNHLFRIRLACILLETCGTYFSSGSSKRRLDYYILFLQSYFWYKRSFWKEGFPSSLEHLYTDTLTTLRPKMKFCKNFEDTLIQLDQLRTTLGIDKIADHHDDSSLPPIAESDNEDPEEEISEHAQITDDTCTEDEAADCTQTSEGEITLGRADEQVVPGLSNIRRNECPEDTEFVNALEKMVAENIQERIKEVVKPANSDISVPVVSRPIKKSYEQLQELSDSNKEKIAFVLMVRKGNKQQYKNFEADINSPLAQNLRNQEYAQKEERERVKRLTLNITERFEEEDYQEVIQQQARSSNQNLNRDRKKYQHPKGAPDADLIFGSKKLR